MKPFTFDQIPKMFTKLFDKMEQLEKLVKGIPAAGKKDDEILSIKQASKLLNLAVATIYSKVSKNEIPVNKQGKRLYFYRSELMEWIKSGRNKTNEEIGNEVNRPKILVKNKDQP